MAPVRSVGVISSSSRARFCQLALRSKIVSDATFDVHRPIQLDIAKQHARIERQLVAPDPYVKP
eukprot:1967127-Alexandrium_andersonii.AAC.1